ncbi:quinol dehydrogenase ferredoxin subunit NapH [Billgrantia azerbaijanica]|nr:quinol dehydrogenase ferredoxin subunit NapH [Halomonas azerbaijanica]
MARQARPGLRMTRERGWWPAHRFLLLRRLTQASVLGLFLLGPLAGLWVVKGNLASSLTLGVLPLTDPYLLLQSLAAGHAVGLTAWVGALIVLGAYLLLGGRVYCAWVCPLNVVTDSAAWLRRRLGITHSARFSRATRYWLLAATLVLALATGSLAWEWVNPVSIVFRSLVFGLGLAWGVIVALFLFDLLVARRGWCSHLCPMGAFYSLPGHLSLLRVNAAGRARCDDCMDCYAVCPEPQVIAPALKPRGEDAGVVIRSAQCTNCARCIDVCSQDVFAFGSRFVATEPTRDRHKREIAP